MDASEIRDGVVAKNPQSYAAYLAQRSIARSSLCQGRRPISLALQQLAPEAADVIVAAGNAALEKGNFVEGKDAPGTRRSSFPRDVRMYQGLAETESKAGRPDEAVAVLRRGDKRPCPVRRTFNGISPSG